MKKILALVLATLMIATVFTACGDTAAPDAAGDAPASEAGDEMCIRDSLFRRRRFCYIQVDIERCQGIY